MAESISSENLVIVGCGKAKVWDGRRSPGRVRAKDAYIGSLFKSQRRFAERHAVNWLILSAKYGLLRPDQLISDYDITLGSRSAITARRIRSQWRRRFGDKSTVAICLASKNYVRLLRDSIPEAVTLRTPLDGLGLFERMRWLRKHR